MKRITVHKIIFSPDSGELMLGDIVLSVEKVVKQKVNMDIHR